MYSKITDELWQQWLAGWNHILDISKKKGWEHSELRIEPPMSLKAVEEICKKHHLVLPGEFVEVVTKYASAVEFTWDGSDAENPKQPDFLPKLYGPYRPLWDITNVGWMTEACRDSADCDYSQAYTEAWSDKTGFIDEGGGDYWAFDMKNGDEHCPVWYLGHDEFQEPGVKQAENFIDFITKVSAWGMIVDRDDLHDADKCRIWHDWLDGKEIYLEDTATVIDPLWTVEYYSNGKRQAAGLKNEKGRQGKWIFWSEWGYKSGEATFADGQTLGPQTSYYWNGKVASEGEYRPGWAPHGKVIYYDEAGRKKAETNWNARQKDGLDLSWYDNGLLKSQAMYRDDKLHGEYMLWYCNGQLLGKAVYEGGKKVEG